MRIRKGTCPVACTVSGSKFALRLWGGDDGMTQLSEKGAEILNSTEEDSDTDVEPLKQKTKLPEDGIITQAQMETIAGKDEKYYFIGKTDSGISYKWTYNGSQIQNPVEQKLLVQCSEDGTEEVKKLANDAPYALKVTLEKMNLAAPAKLTLNLKEKWDADKVLYCLEEDGKLYQLDTAKITTRETGKKKTERTTLTFNVTKTGGDFYLIGGSTTGESTDESDDKSKGTADNKDTQNGEIPLEVLAVSPAQMEIPVPDRQTLPAMEQAIQTLPVAMTAQIQP